MDKNTENTGLHSSLARGGRSGSILVLTALMMVVLMGFVGLAIDVGHRMDVYRQTQDAADGAALAGAHAFYVGSEFSSPQWASFAPAQAAAALLARQNGFSSSNLQLTYFDQNWNPIDPNTSPRSSVFYVQALVSSTFPNYFIPVLGLNQSSVGSRAVAEVNKGGCNVAALCVLNPAQSCALDVTGGAAITLNNTVVVDNSAYGKSGNGSLCVDGGASIQNAPDDSSVIYNVGVNKISGTVSPTPVSTSHISDPLAYLPPPPLTGKWCGAVDITSAGDKGSQICSTSSSGVTTITQGVYCGIHVESTGKLILQPGIYVIFNGDAGSNSCIGPHGGVGLQVDGGASICSQTTTVGTPCTSNTASLPNGVMLYLTCGSSKTTGGVTTGSASACTSPKEQSAGAISIAGGATVNLQGIQDTSGDQYSVYNGMLIFYDRMNTNPMALAGNSTSTFTGTIYGAQASLTITGDSSVAMGLDSKVVVNTLAVNGTIGTTSNGKFAFSNSAGSNADFKAFGGLVQ